jgi:hypothetical protein
MSADSVSLPGWLSDANSSVIGISMWKPITVILVGFLVVIIIIKYRKGKGVSLTDVDWQDAFFIGMNLYSCLVAIVFALTGQFLFNDDGSARLAMAIAALSLFLYVKREISKFKKSSNSRV